MEECDLVMKGGVTSGTVYPKAISRLARDYRFRSIGGTSAGAIAAAAAAAAEFRRQTSPNKDSQTGFNVLEQLPQRLGSPGSKGMGATLLELFQPQSAFAALFRFLLAFIGNDRTKGGTAKPPSKIATWLLIGRVSLNMIRYFWVWALLGAVALIAFAWLLGVSFHPSWRYVGILLYLYAGASLAALWGVWRSVLKLPANNFGLCRGFERPAEGKKEDGTHLTPWLHSLIQETSGRSAADSPLTFGELKREDIEFRAITSNLSYGQPHRIPFGDGEAWQFFDEEEWASMFPQSVIEHLKSHPPTRYTAPSSDDDQAYVLAVNRIKSTQKLLPLPDANDLPIIIAVRLSLSFPILLSATPIYLLDPAQKDGLAKKCWFSDGGLSSNFPLHFFDSVIPSRPTFAINLQEVKKGDPKARTYLAKTNSDGLAHPWTDIETDDKQGALFGFLLAIFNVMQNWRDNSLLRLPGYRDRVAMIRLEPHEGGLNLNMPKPLIDTLSELGEQAADKLVLHFLPANRAACLASGIRTTWENHRWVRLLSALAGLERLATEFEEAWITASDDTYESLLDPMATPVLPSYRNYSDKQRKLALCFIAGLRNVVVECQAAMPSTGLSQNTPRPPMHFRLTAES